MSEIKASPSFVDLPVDGRGKPQSEIPPAPVKDAKEEDIDTPLLDFSLTEVPTGRLLRSAAGGASFFKNARKDSTRPPSESSVGGGGGGGGGRLRRSKVSNVASFYRNSGKMRRSDDAGGSDDEAVGGLYGSWYDDRAQLASRGSVGSRADRAQLASRGSVSRMSRGSVFNSKRVSRVSMSRDPEDESERLRKYSMARKLAAEALVRNETLFEKLKRSRAVENRIQQKALEDQIQIWNTAMVLQQRTALLLEEMHLQRSLRSLKKLALPAIRLKIHKFRRSRPSDNSPLKAPTAFSVREDKMFSSWSTNSLEVLLSNIKPMHVTKGSIIFYERIPATAAYYLQRGSVKREVNRLSTILKAELSQVGKSEWMGVYEILFEEKMRFTSTALTDCLLWIVPSDVLLISFQLMEPDQKESTISIAATRACRDTVILGTSELEEAFNKIQSNLISSLSSSQKTMLVNVAKPFICKRGDLIAQQGVKSKLLIITEGTTSREYVDSVLHPIEKNESFTLSYRVCNVIYIQERRVSPPIVNLQLIGEESTAGVVSCCTVRSLSCVRGWHLPSDSWVSAMLTTPDVVLENTRIIYDKISQNITRLSSNLLILAMKRLIDNTKVHWNTSAVDLMISGAIPKFYSRGMSILKPVDTCDGFYVIVKGKVQHTNDDREIFPGGSVFGLYFESLMENSRWGAEVVALTDCECWFVSRELLSEFLSKQSEMINSLIDTRLTQIKIAFSGVEAESEGDTDDSSSSSDNNFRENEGTEKLSVAIKLKFKTQIQRIKKHRLLKERSKRKSMARMARLTPNLLAGARTTATPDVCSPPETGVKKAISEARQLIKEADQYRNVSSRLMTLSDRFPIFTDSAGIEMFSIKRSSRQNSRQSLRSRGSVSGRRLSRQSSRSGRRLSRHQSPFGMKSLSCQPILPKREKPAHQLLECTPNRIDTPPPDESDSEQGEDELSLPQIFKSLRQKSEIKSVFRIHRKVPPPSVAGGGGSVVVVHKTPRPPLSTEKRSFRKIQSKVVPPQSRHPLPYFACSRMDCRTETRIMKFKVDKVDRTI